MMLVLTTCLPVITPQSMHCERFNRSTFYIRKAEPKLHCKHFKVYCAISSLRGCSASAVGLTIIIMTLRSMTLNPKSESRDFSPPAAILVALLDCPSSKLWDGEAQQNLNHNHQEPVLNKLE